MELKFRTKSLSAARKVALPLIEKRCDSFEPILVGEVAEWVDRRFPALIGEDRANLTNECSKFVMERTNVQ
jgi:hypothetical protein